MKSLNTLKKSNQHGFTLIEIMVVVAILGVLVALVGPAVFGQQKDAYIKSTRTQIRNIESSMDMYRLKFNSYPSTEEGIEALVSPSEGDPIMAKLPKDAWSQPFQYVNNGETIDIISAGPDKQAGTADDISNSDE